MNNLPITLFYTRTVTLITRFKLFSFRKLPRASEHMQMKS